MSLVTQRKGYLTEGERALLLFTADERRELCDRICHVFQVLASSMMLEYPLTDAIPSVAGARDRLLGKIFRFRKENAVTVSDQASSSSLASPSDETLLPLQAVVEERDYALLYAYAPCHGSGRG